MSELFGGETLDFHREYGESNWRDNSDVEAIRDLVAEVDRLRHLESLVAEARRLGIYEDDPSWREIDTVIGQADAWTQRPDGTWTR